MMLRYKYTQRRNHIQTSISSVHLFLRLFITLDTFAALFQPQFYFLLIPKEAPKNRHNFSAVVKNPLKNHVCQLYIYIFIYGRQANTHLTLRTGRKEFPLLRVWRQSCSLYVKGNSQMLIISYKLLGVVIIGLLQG